MTLSRFNALPAPEARSALGEVCAAEEWAAAVLAGRPYANTAALHAASDAATAALEGPGLDAALAGHPPIGAPGDATSAREQSAVAEAPAELRARIRTLTLAYQEKFRHVFLVRATGRTAADILAALEERLGNTPATERARARSELAAIHRVRLDRLFPEHPDGAERAEGPEHPARPEPGAPDEPAVLPGPATVSTHVLDTSAGRPAPAVPVTLAARPGPTAPWSVVGTSETDTDGRCRDLPALPPGTTEARLEFATAGHVPGASFFPEVSLVFRAAPGEHHHVPLLLSPYGYSAYRGS
ncbi:2-oxo-4-hydroxy-4-carboxy-5-ureidoimidazoline decarboxylase [Streptomyces sp. SPB074]|uniref:2-oxo-4-hydroxy-4-carboxy-5-ureidoimidazoline decarboxylase n=1 Tax=Streptomyces sp. (strain SPB074) TaxID=465543 RepID=UPI00017F265F|nr:2-oxo-4-hydroxy-4-carboxy-5-ureidoimidazoline decarboxylase [Streptomyces sp. SPB074]EDY46685.1 allantoicase [Streptomyces sp. SPB074]